MRRQGYVSRLPQFRVTVNSRCGRACFFCRPSGEAVATAAGAELPVDDLVRVGRAVRRAGVEGVKLTGGDPALYAPLEEAVRRLRQEAGFDDIEVISRHPLIGQRAAELTECGVTRFNMSIDTLDPGLHHEVCGVDDLPAVLGALAECVATGLPVKVNMVVMAGVNDAEVADLATFCERAGVETLKLLDVIRDLDSGSESFARRLALKRGRLVDDLYVPLDAVAAGFAGRAVRTETRTQGGLGHPMTALVMSSGFEVVLKDSRAGAWYGDVCNGCRFFPCHDALMALRLTADRRLQLCLLREDITVPLADALAAGDDDHLVTLVDSAITAYTSARFQQPAPRLPTIAVGAA